MKWLSLLLAILSIAGCAGLNLDDEGSEPKTAPAQVGVVNHTGNYIYSASADGAGNANICCASIPRVWYSGMKVSVRWNMPVHGNDVIKEKIVEVEKYDEPGDIYLHFFPNDEIRVVVTNVYPWHPEHPIPPPIKPANAK